MNEALEKIRQEALARLQEVREEKELEELNSSVLGRSGSLTGILRTMGQLDKEQRAKLGQASNAVKKELEQAMAERRAKIAQLMQQKAFEKETLDVTEPGIRRQPSGRLHPMTQTYREIRDALIGMGFTTFHGPEVEYDDFNFTKLNLPKDHPARDMQDTFYVNDKVVLRTHTSPCEARALMTVKPPFRLVIPGRVFRVDEVDASHSPVFMQMEGLVVDKNISFADLKGTLDEFVHTVFGPDVKTLCARATSRLPNPLPRLIFPAPYAAARAAVCARARAGLKYWAAALPIRMSLKTAVLIRMSGARLPLA